MSTNLINKSQLDIQALYWSNIFYSAKDKIYHLKELINITLIQYRVDERSIFGMIIEPKNKTKKHPVIIYNRGGNNIDPDKNDMSTHFGHIYMTSLFSYAARHNYVIYTTQLSGYGENSGKDEFGGEDLNDILALKDLIDQNPICDSQRVAMLGYSRGGMMAYLSLLKAPWLKTIAVVGGPSNLINEANWRPEMQKFVFEPAFGGSDEEKKKRSIFYNADKVPKDSNILILHGLKDDRVNPEDAIKLDRVFTDIGINHKLVTFADGSHGLTENREARDKEIIEWFNKYL